MECHHMQRRHLLAIVVMCATGLAITSTATGQSAQGKVFSIQEKLALKIETQAFTNPMTLKDMLQLLYERYLDQIDLNVLVDIASFKTQDERAASPYDAQVQLPAVPKVIALADAFQIILWQMPKDNAATLLLRDGKAMIVAKSAATAEVLLQESLRAHRLDKKPFAEAMQQMSDLSGLSILIDPRLKEKAQAPISADFRGDIPVEAALRMLADMVDARIVLMGGGVYVTTPANADLLEQERRHREQERERRDRERLRNLPPQKQERDKE